MTNPFKALSAFTVFGVTATLIILGLGFWLAFFSYGQLRRAPEIVVATSNWPSARLLAAANDRGYFARHGIGVEVRDVGDDYGRVDDEVVSGRADGGAFVLSEPILLTGGGIPMNVIINVDYSAGAMGVVSSGELQAVADLRGRRVAFEPDSFEELLLTAALTQAGLTLADITPVPRWASDGARGFLDEEVEAAVLFEPFLRQSLVRPGSRLLYSSREAPGLLPQVLSFRSDFVATHRPELLAFTAGWFDMVHDLTTDSELRKEILATAAIQGGLSLADMEHQLEGVHLFTLEENLTAFESETPSSLAASAERFTDFFMTSGRLMEGIESQEFIDPYFVRAISPSP